MGKTFSVLRRKINRFNVESRAQTIIAKDKPVPAPKHQSTIKEFEKIKQEISNMPEASAARDAVLHDKLKEVYVRSVDHCVWNKDPATVRLFWTKTCPACGLELNLQIADCWYHRLVFKIEIQGSDSSRLLPQERRPATEAPQLGFEEPSLISEGRCSLQQALKFIGDHQEDPVRWKQDIIAQEYKLQPQIVEKILQHYRIFQVYLPTDKERKEAMFVLPMQMKKRLAADPDPEIKLTEQKVSETAIEDK